MCYINSVEQAKRFAFLIWMTVCYHEVVTRGKKSYAKTTYLHAHAKNVKNKKVIQMSQATKKTSTMMMMMKIWGWTRIETMKNWQKNKTNNNNKIR